LKTKGKYKHRGEILQTAVNKSPIKITELVRRMNISRGTYYNHKDDPALSFEIATTDIISFAEAC